MEGLHWDSNPFYVYAGGDSCRHIHKKHFVILNGAAQDIYFKYKEAKDRRVVFGDAGSMGGVCQGHPGNSHNGLGVIDICYYTRKTNFTQKVYTPGGAAKTSIWIGNKLNINVFDCERNFRFWDYCYKYNKKFRIVTDIRVFVHMYSFINKTYGAVAANRFDGYVNTSAAGLWNHDEHGHATFGDV